MVSILETKVGMGVQAGAVHVLSSLTVAGRGRWRQRWGPESRLGLYSSLTVARGVLCSPKLLAKAAHCLITGLRSVFSINQELALLKGPGIAAM